MHCSNCGKPMEGIFCGECGARNEPVAGAEVTEQAAPKAKKKANSRLIVSLVLGLLLVVFSGVAIGQNASANTHKAGAITAASKRVNAMNQVTYYEDLAASNRSLAATDEVYKTSCYYNVWCSVDTYRGWINLINRLNSNAEEDDAQAAQWTITANSWTIIENSHRSSQRTAEIVRGVTTGLAIASGLGLIVFNVLAAARAKRKKVAA